MLFYTLNEKSEFEQEFYDICFKEWQSYLIKKNIRSSKDLENYYKSLNMTTYILLDRDRIIGFYSLYFITDSRIMISNVWMHPDERRKHKSVLMRHALIKIGNKNACLFAEKKMVSYYARFGFKVSKYNKDDKLYLMENTVFNKILFFYLIICAIIIGIILWFILCFYHLSP